MKLPRRFCLYLIMVSGVGLANCAAQPTVSIELAATASPMAFQSRATAVPTNAGLPVATSTVPPEVATQIETQGAPTATPTPMPARLIIPDLDLDQRIVPVPIRAGMWDISELKQEVGRLATTGERPLDVLAPVLVGHVSLENGTSGPFGYLWKLRPGSAVFYEWEGQQYRYRVESKETVDSTAQAAIYVADGQRLLLVTCDGWDVTSWGYTQRLVVAAALESIVAAP